MRAPAAALLLLVVAETIAMPTAAAPQHADTVLVISGRKRGRCRRCGANVPRNRPPPTRADAVAALDTFALEFVAKYPKRVAEVCPSCICVGCRRVTSGRRWKSLLGKDAAGLSPKGAGSRTKGLLMAFKLLERAAATPAPSSLRQRSCAMLRAGQVTLQQETKKPNRQPRRIAT
jgi:hypothetical protein